MKSVAYESREAWLNGRLGTFGGSSLKDVVNTRDGATKAGVYRTAAESIIGSAILAEDQLTSAQAMQRGHDLEPDAIKRFEKETGRKVNTGLVIWQRDDDPRMSYSPDGWIGKAATEVVEVKCLLSTKHVEALYTRQIPKNTAGYEEQRIQAFIVNEKLKKVHHVFYHPDFPAGLDFMIVTTTRAELQEEVDRYLMLEREAVGRVREIVNALTLYSPEDVAKMDAVKEELLADNRTALERVHSGMMERINE